MRPKTTTTALGTTGLGKTALGKTSLGMTGLGMTGLATTTLALAAVLALTACSAGSAPDGGTASDPPATAAAPAPAETPSESDAETEATAEPAGVTHTREHCEAEIEAGYARPQARMATAEDDAMVVGLLGIDPGDPLCGVVSLPDDGTGTYTLQVYLDQPALVDEVADALAGSGWTMAEESAAGYTILAFTKGDVVVDLSPIGVDHPISSWGQMFPGADVTLITVDQP